MASQQPLNTEKYEGLNQMEGAFGKSSVDSNTGFLAGAGIGAVAGLAALKFKPSIFGSLAQHKGFAVAVSALAVGTVVSAVAGIRGLFTGVKKADRGREQFELLKTQRDEVMAERNMAVAKVNGLEAEVASLHHQIQSHEKFTDKIQSRAASGSHVAAHEEHKQHEAVAEHGR